MAEQRGEGELVDSTCADQAALVSRARNGDHLAFMSLVDPHRRRIWHLAWRFAGNPDDAEDLVQEALARAYCYFSRYRQSAEFGPWLMKIAVNACLAQRRRRRRASAEQRAAESAWHDASGAEGPSEAASRRGLQAQVRAAIAALPPRQRAAAILFHIKGQTIGEVAELMGCTAGTVKRHLHRARATLAIRLGGLARDAEPGREGGETWTTL